MRILKDLWEDLGYENLGLSAQNLRDHAAAITDENPQISARGDSSTTLDETEEVGASMLSQTESIEPAECEGENLSNVNVVEGSNLHISSDIELPRDTLLLARIKTPKIKSSQICRIMMCFPLK